MHLLPSKICSLLTPFQWLFILINSSNSSRGWKQRLVNANIGWDLLILCSAWFYSEENILRFAWNFNKSQERLKFITTSQSHQNLPRRSQLFSLKFIIIKCEIKVNLFHYFSFSLRFTANFSSTKLGESLIVSECLWFRFLVLFFFQYSLFVRNAISNRKNVTKIVATLHEASQRKVQLRSVS